MVYICVYICMYIYIYTCIYIYAYIYIYELSINPIKPGKPGTVIEPYGQNYERCATESQFSGFCGEFGDQSLPVLPNSQ